MKITEALRGEHGVFYAQFDHMARSVPQAQTLAQLQSSVAMLDAALASHAKMEDELLFSNLEPHLGPMGPLAVMRMEHDEIEGASARIKEVQDIAEARALALSLVQVARNHFAKEEQILFHMAEEVLDEDTLERLGVQWAERRGVAI
ncbi:MAG: hemerythrin domain-containing protein [Chloroflexi bacterium]|nr:hemerythrin domain-containing protein [Chloroflexota bacterium]